MGNLTNSSATTPVSEYDATKVATYNAALQILDSAINGRLAISTTGGTTTLTGTPAAPQAQNLFIDVSGTLTSNAIVEIPVAAGTGRNRIYIVKNGTSGAFTLTVRKVGGTGVAVTQGYTAVLLYNDTDIVKLFEVNHSTGLIARSAITTYAARVYNNANISINNATSTVLTFNSERRDDGALHDTGSNTSRLTAPVAGWYSIFAAVAFEFHATGLRSANIKLNGSTIIANTTIPAVATDSEGTSLTPATLYYLAAGDYVEVFVYQTSGGARNVVTVGNYSPEFGMVLVG